LPNSAEKDAAGGTAGAATLPVSEKAMSGEDSGGVFSATQQRQLEEALAKTSDKTPNRWQAVADAVEGKTRAECIQRYSQFCSFLDQIIFDIFAYVSQMQVSSKADSTAEADVIFLEIMF
jgi:hypothetical protein